MPTKSNDLVFVNDGKTSAPLKVGGHVSLKVKAGEHYRVVVHQDSQLPLLDNVIARRVGHDLQLVYADGTQVTLENYYFECKGPAACDITLPGSNGGTVTLSADNAVDPSEAKLDNSGLVYVHGNHDSLMDLVQTGVTPAISPAMTPAISTAITPIATQLATPLATPPLLAVTDIPPGTADNVAPTPSASSHGAFGIFGNFERFGDVQGFGGLALLGGGIGLAAVAGGGGGGGSAAGGSAAAAPVHQFVTGSISGGPVVPGNDLTVNLYASDGATLLGTAKVNDAGFFSIDVGAYTGAVIAKLQNGGGASDFIDEATGRNIDINANLMSTGVIGANAIGMNINLLTTLAALKAGALFNAASNSALTADSVTANNAAVASAFGLTDLTGTSIISTIDTSNNANPAYTPDNLNNAVKYGAMLAILSGVDFINGGQIQSTLDNMVAALTVNGSSGTLSVPFQSILLAGAAAADANTPGDLSATFISTIAFDVAGAAAALGSNLSALSAQQLQLLQLAVISALSASQVHTFTAPQIMIFSPAQIAALGPNLAALSDGALAGLDALQVAAIAAHNFALLSTAQLLLLSGAEIAGVTAEQIDALNPLQIAALSLEIAALATDAMASLDAPQVAAVPGPAFATLSNTQLAALTPGQANAITASQIDALSPQQITALGFDLDALSTSALAALDAPQMAAIAAAVLAALSNTQLAALTGAQLGALTASQIDALSPQQIAALGLDISALPAALLAGLSEMQLAAIAPADFATFNEQQLAALTANQIGAITASQIAALSPSQIAALGVDITALAPPALAVLNAQQVAAIAGSDFATLSNAQLAALSAIQLSGITADQINALSPAQIVILGVNQIDTTQPHISNIILTDAEGVHNNSLNAGDTVFVTVLLSETGNVSGLPGPVAGPELALNIGGALVQASYVSGSGTRVLVFGYTILAGQNDANGISIEANSLSLNDSALFDGAGTALALNYPRVADNASYLVDTIAPAINSVAISSASGSQHGVLNAGDVVNITVTLSEVVLLTGAPQLLLNIGGAVVAASYTSGSSSANLLFSYTILASQNDSNGISIDANSLILNGAILTDAAGNTAVLDQLAVSDNPLYLVDTTAPSISNIILSSGAGIQNNLLNAGDIVSATVTMSEASFVSNPAGSGPQLALNIGGTTVEASYVAGSGSTHLLFAYTILAGQNDANGISIDANSLSGGNGTVSDGAGNAALLNHPAVADNGAYLVDTVAPAINSIAITSAAGIQNSVLNAGDLLTIKVALSEATLVTATQNNAPQLALNIGGSTVQASYVFGGGGSTLVFNYTIVAGQNDANGVSIDANSLFLHGGALQDAAGNNAMLSSLAVPDNGAYLVDTTPPAILSVAITSASGIENNTLTAGDSVFISVVMSEATTGIPQLALNIGGTTVEADYASGSGTSNLTFSYTILAGQNDSNGISIDANSLALFSGTLLDAAGNAAVQSNLAVPDNPAYIVDTSVLNTNVLDTSASSLSSTAQNAANDVALNNSVAGIEPSQVVWLDSGNGFDTLSLSGSGITLDLSAIASQAVVPGTALEGIKLNGANGNGNGSPIGTTGGNNNTLKLALSDVLNLAGVNLFNSSPQSATVLTAGSISLDANVARHQLLIDGNQTDTINSSGWGTSSGTVLGNGHTYAVYNQGAFAQLLIDQTIVTHVL